MLDAVLNETLRLYPPSAYGTRVVKEQMELDWTDVHGKANHLVLAENFHWLFSIYSIHRLEEYWGDNPNAFDERRWLKEFSSNYKKPHNFAFLPFGAGPRGCLGSHFAMLEAKIILVKLLQHFDFSMLPGQKVEPLMVVTMKPKFGIFTKITLRNKTLGEE